MTVARLSHEVTSTELTEWMAYLNLEEYEKKFEQEAMTDEDRSKAIKNLILGASNVR